jgi:hypothetical protein
MITCSLRLELASLHVQWLCGHDHCAPQLARLIEPDLWHVCTLPDARQHTVMCVDHGLPGGRWQTVAAAGGDV